MRILQNYRKFSTKTLDGWAKSVQKSGKNVFVKIDKGRAGEPIQLVANKEIGQESE